MDAHAWDERYRGSELVWSAGPNAFVVEHLAGLRPGRALDVACGEGRNALWLAEQGWDAVGVDFSPVAIDKARQIAEKRGVGVDFRVGDVADPSVVEGEFDLIVLAYLHLGAGLDDILRTLAGQLAPGGTLFVLGHHADNIERGHGGPPDPSVLHDPAHVAGVLRDAGLTVTSEGELERHVDTDDGPRTAIDSLVIAVA